MSNRFPFKKYTGPGSKSICPGCNDRSLCTFTDIEGKVIFPDYVGVCDHKNSCAYCYTPQQYLKDNPEERRRAYQEATSRAAALEPEPEKIPMVLPGYLIDQAARKAEETHFFAFLCIQFGEEHARQLARRFRLGGSNALWPGSAVFWIIKDGKPYGGQVIDFDPETGKTVRKPEEDRRRSGWIHTALERAHKDSGKPLPDWLTRYQKDAPKFPFLFGLQAMEGGEKPVVIVESAKTAILMTGILPKFDWLAVGSLSYLNAARLEPVKGRKIVLYPDLGAYNAWSIKAAQLTALGFNISVSDFLERRADPEEKAAGFDVADYFIKNASENRTDDAGPVQTPVQRTENAVSPAAKNVRHGAQILPSSERQARPLTLPPGFALIPINGGQTLEVDGIPALWLSDLERASALERAQGFEHPALVVLSPQAA